MPYIALSLVVFEQSPSYDGGRMVARYRLGGGREKGYSSGTGDIKGKGMELKPPSSATGLRTESEMSSSMEVQAEDEEAGQENEEGEKEGGEETGVSVGEGDGV
ncbi:hypothetical protein JCM8547_007058 [Rhodosporidiobolus lusitaniae]